MYNRYLSGELIPDESAAVDTTPPVTDSTPTQKSSELSGLLSGFLRNLHFDTDDLLLLAIVWLLLRDSGDDDILIIILALFFTGFFSH